MIQGGELGQSGAKRTILVVEDNEINREMLVAFLEDDFEVLEAEDGFAGLRQVEEHYSDLSLVLTDLLMPECTGLEMLEKMRADERFDSIPVVVATASGSSEDEMRCLEYGANDFVTKPYQIDIMVNRINNLIRLRESASIVNLLTWDDTTNLYTKAFFFRTIEDTLAANPGKAYDVVCSDIDNFKALNDRYGEKRCDLLLHDLATKLMESLPGVVAGGRVGGDAFGFLLEHQEEDWTGMLEDLIAGMDVVNLNMQFGILEDVDRELSASQACDRASVALESVKGPLGVGVARYDEKLHEAQVMEQHILESMESALVNHDFKVYYQPKHNVHTDKTGGAEALVRWIHPELGFMNPGVFIPLFEQNGFIAKLDMYVWEEACKEIKRCEELGLPRVPISINASRLDFDNPNLAQDIEELADRYGVDHDLLHVEVTETAYSENPKAVIDILSDLRSRGFLSELDDFGAGYSSLESLNVLPLDVMKLDMSMIRHASALNDFRIINSTIRLSHDLGLKNVVEGVETAEEVEKLKELGCDLIQGYYFSRPLKQEEFEEYLAKE